MASTLTLCFWPSCWKKVVLILSDWLVLVTSVSSVSMWELKLMLLSDFREIASISWLKSLMALLISLNCSLHCCKLGDLGRTFLPGEFGPTGCLVCCLLVLLESDDGMVGGGDCFCNPNFLCCHLGLTVAEHVLFSPMMCWGSFKADADFEVLTLVVLSVAQVSRLKGPCIWLFLETRSLADCIENFLPSALPWGFRSTDIFSVGIMLGAGSLVLLIRLTGFIMTVGDLWLFGEGDPLIVAEIGSLFCSFLGLSKFELW